MLVTLRWKAILVGLVVGTLALAAVALVVWLGLAAAGVAEAAAVATSTGTLAGLLAAGWWAGRHATHSHWFHGSVAALGIALVVVVTAVRGGSPAPTAQVLGLAGIAIALGAAGGILGGRRR